MYNLLVVDDEQIVIDSIKFMVGKFMNSALNIETAHSGREAIEKSINFYPDFVIIDIKMPGISGLDAIKEIKNIHSGTLFIVISAFANFDYAKEALQLGVIEYLNKPLSRGNLTAALENAIRIKDRERSKLKTELEIREKMAFIQPALENSFIYYVILPDDHSADMESLKRILDLGSDSGYIMTVEFGEGKSKDGLVNKIDSSIKSQKMYPFIRETIKEFCRCIVGPLMVNRIITYVSCNSDDDEYTKRIETLDIGAKIYKKLTEQDSSVNYYIGVGRSYSSLKEINKSYEESLKAIDYGKESGVFHINDIPVERNLKRAYPKDVEQTIVKKITLGETDAGLLAFEYLFNWTKEQYSDNINELKSSLVELVVMIFGVLKTYGLDTSGTPDNDYIVEFMSLRDEKAVQSWVKNAIRAVSNNMVESREKNLSAVIKAAMNYIMQNYSKNITLEDVSKAVNISPTYFSKMFKEEAGSTFIDYLTALRIRQAKKLIADSNYGNKEICDLVGYSDPNYFSRVFKKIVGVTPTEYRSSLSDA